VGRGIDVLLAVRADRPLLVQAARALCRAQPAMAGFRTAAAMALAKPEGLEALAQRVRRAPAAVARVSVPALALRPDRGRPLTLVTCSRSAAVERTILLAAATERVLVRCAESRPGREGADLAEALAAAGLAVELYTDAGIGSAVADADAAIVGADALSGRAFINKVGTGAVCACARAAGVHVLVLAGREKILPDAAFAQLQTASVPAPGAAVAAGVTMCNPSFERVSLDLVSLIGTDAGVMPPEEVPVASMWDMSLLSASNMLDRD
jgi:translation initiation factor 2B subunit (eIF-2B alpha/beta/delta family)